MNPVTFPLYSPTFHDWVVTYLTRGWRAVPIPFREKGPRIKGWPNLKIDPSELHAYFPPGVPMNVGIVLGDVSGIVDIDLDSTEAIQLAPQFLPATGSVFGRQSKRASHLIYRVAPGTAGSTNRYDWVRPCPKDEKEKPKPIVEYRAHGGIQTVFPGSVHRESGEPIFWHSDCEPALVDAAELRAAVLRLANACRALRGEPPVGQELVGQAVVSAAPPVAPATPPAPMPQLSGGVLASPAIVERCRGYLMTLADSVSGEDGHGRAFQAACIPFEFALADDQAWQVLQEFNLAKCKPPFSPAELAHKFEDAKDKVTRTGNVGRMLREVKPAAPSDLAPNGLPQWIADQKMRPYRRVIMEFIGRGCRHTIDEHGSRGYCFAGRDTIAKACGIGKATVPRHIKTLIGEGLLAKVETGGISKTTGEAFANVYVLPGKHGLTFSPKVAAQVAVSAGYPTPPLTLGIVGDQTDTAKAA